MKEIKVKKGQILQKPGEYNSKGYLVKSGLLRSYSIDEKGKEHIFMFAPEDWTIADYTSKFEPTNLFIDALEDSTLIRIEKDFGAIKSKEVIKLIRRAHVLQNRIVMLMSSPAIERYEHFVETYPDIIQRVPQRMIASYLGITPEALSAVKRKRVKKQ
ncbi:MAG: Crp/Fnr family transcriptional regulator [Saprospiraceae bacterium]